MIAFVDDFSMRSEADSEMIRLTKPAAVALADINHRLAGCVRLPQMFACTEVKAAKHALDDLAKTINFSAAEPSSELKVTKLNTVKKSDIVGKVTMLSEQCGAIAHGELAERMLGVAPHLRPVFNTLDECAKLYENFASLIASDRGIKVVAPAGKSIG